MATEKQIAANRRNAAKSTGPKTEKGKGRSRSNATTHGLTAVTTIFRPVRHEDPAVLAEIRTKLLTDCEPVGAQELIAVEMMVAAFIRIRRVDAIEAAFFTGALAAMERQHEVEHDDARNDDLGCGIALGKEHRLTWDNLDRYRRRAWLDYNRAQEQLRKLQKDRIERPAREYRAAVAAEKLRKLAALAPQPVAAEAEMGSFCTAAAQASPDREMTCQGCSEMLPSDRSALPQAA